MTDSLRPIELFSPDRHVVGDFHSGVSSLDGWLKFNAASASVAGTAATWVLLRDTRVIGYYALAMGGLMRDSIPARLGRGHPDPVPILLLARLALCLDEQGRGLGGFLLADALRRSVIGASHYGARALIVDAINERAYYFYRHHGFLPLAGWRLYRRMSDIAKSM